MLNVFATCTDHETNQLGYSVLNGAIAWSTRKVEGEDGEDDDERGKRIKVEASGVSEWAYRISYRSRLLTRATQLDGMRRRERERERE